MRKLLKVTKKSLVSFRFGVFSMWLFESVWCVVFFLSFFHGWWWHHTHPNRLHYCIKLLKVDITFLRLIILCSAHFQQRTKKNHLLKWRNPGSYHSKMPRGLWWIGLTDCLTTPQLLPETRRSSSWIQTQMVCGLPFGNQKSFIFQSTILMFLSDGEQFFRQGKEERFRRLKEFITRIPGAVDLCLPMMWRRFLATQIVKLSIWELKLLKFFMVRQTENLMWGLSTKEYLRKD